MCSLRHRCHHVRLRNRLRLPDGDGAVLIGSLLRYWGHKLMARHLPHGPQNTFIVNPPAAQLPLDHGVAPGFKIGVAHSHSTHKACAGILSNIMTASGACVEGYFRVNGELLGPSKPWPPSLRSHLFAAFTPEAVGFSLVNRMAVVGPLLPTHVEFLCQKPVLCQLQSCFRGELSIMAPAVRHDLLVPGQVLNELI